MVKYNMLQGSEEWQEIRAGRITGTRFKILMSGSNTKGYKDLITELAGERITGIKEDSYTDYNMQRGIELEPEAVLSYEDSYFQETEEVGFIAPDYDNCFHEWIGVSVDRLILDGKGILEVKCPKMKTHLNYIKSNKPVTTYRYQIQAQLYVTGLEYVDFMSYYPGMKPFIKRIFPEKDLHKEFENKLHQAIYQVKSEIEIYKKYNYL